MGSSSGSSVFSFLLLLALLLSRELFICKCDSQVGCLASKRKALLQFKNSLSDPENRLSSWEGHECCGWRGITCDNLTGSVLNIDLHNPHPFFSGSGDSAALQLSGSIDESLLQLKNLKHLDLSYNAFEGILIPNFIGSLKELRYLNLSNAGFSGIIPSQLGNLTKLQYLDISSSFPRLMVENFQWLSSLPSLIHISMNRVDLSLVGPEWIQVISRLSFLRELHLVSCELSGISQSLPSINLTSLSVLVLSDNNFHSSFPNWFLNLSSLVRMEISNAGLQGSIPEKISSLPNLKILDLSLNDNLTADCSSLLTGSWRRIEKIQLSSNQVYGLLPASVGNITSLMELDLFHNKISGGIPSSIGKLCNLIFLRLDGNNLTLGLPETLERATICRSENPLPSIAHLTMSNNKIAGTLPEWLGELGNLQELVFSYNSIQGSIPPSLGKLSLLTDLSLAGNELSGTLPATLRQLSKLEHLDISSNQLSGLVTESHFSELNNLKSLSMSSNSLILNVSSNWIPPFQVGNLGMGSCQLGPQFPSWLKNQKKLRFLDISNASISSKIPTWFWDLSSNLSLLNISFNRLEGQLPNPVQVAAFADINMRSNFFSGPIPILSNTVELLDLSHNRFSGPIPPAIAQMQPYVIYLSLSNNNLTGEIPAAMGVLEGLQVLDLSRNKLMGTIPASLQNCTYLKALVLDNNNLSGAIPSSLGSLKKLQSLHLSNNKLFGVIPPSLQNCSSLETLDLGNNALDGVIPYWLGERFPALRILRLRSNRFLGKIPTQISNLHSLQVLDLAENNLTGSIPQSLGDLKAMTSSQKVNSYLLYGKYRGTYYEERLLVHVSNNAQVYTKTLSLLTSIDLSGNNLCGEFPANLSKLSGLLVLNLANNHLRGTIPDQINNLHQLLSLDLSSNAFAGDIPSTMSSMTFMSHLNLSNNNFSGKIPTTGQFPTFGASTYSGNPLLCGPLLTLQCDEGSNRKPEGVNTDDTDGGFIDKWSGLSVGLGFAVGLLGLFAVVSIRKSWSTAYFEYVDWIIDKIAGSKNGVTDERNGSSRRYGREWMILHALVAEMLGH